MSVLPDHNYLMIRGNGDDVDPVPRFDDVEVVFDPRPRGDGCIRPYGEHTEGLVGLRSNTWPRFNHGVPPDSISDYKRAQDEGFHSIWVDPVCQIKLIFSPVLGYKERQSYEIPI